jgi:DNA polymerase-3 subunit alpha
MNYVPLHNHSTFSFLDGLFWPKQYIEKAKELGMKAYALTDHGTMSGIFEFYDACKEFKIKPIIGVEAYFTEDKLVKDKNIKYSHIILLAKNKKGYEILLESQYDALKNGFYYKPRIDWSNLEKMIGNVIVMTACSGGIIARYIKEDNMEKAEETIKRLKEMFGDDFYVEYIALQRINNYGPLWVKLRDLAKKYRVKSVITTDTHYLSKTDASLQDIIHNVGTKITMKDIKEGKGWIFEDRDLYLKSYNEVKEIMSNIFNEEIVKKFLNNTIEVADKIEEFDIYPEKHVFPKVDFNEDNFKKILKESLEKKCPKEKMQEYKDRLSFEYKIVKKMGFLEYFWIVADIVNWAKNNDIEVGFGRGSAGGSLIVYLLGITECDPIKFNLPFFRFINPTRNKMPDIDIDFQQAKRQEVLKYIKKYGEDNVFSIANYVKYSLKSATKDVMRIYGVPFQEANNVNKIYDKFGFDKIPDQYKEYYQIAAKLVGNIRNLGKHAAGVVITDKPLYKYMPTSKLHNDIITGIDGKTLQKKKFLKIDILGLDALDTIHLALKYIKKYEGVCIDLLKIDIEDQKVFELFQQADTDNIFQFATPSFKELIREAQPNQFKNLIELNALNRPISKSLNYHIEYVKRRFGDTYYVPKILEKHLKDTYGLLLYQEQVIEILSDLCGVDFGEGENLRREVEVIGLKPVLDRYEKYMKEKYNEKDLNEAIKELEGVAGYAFNKIHSTQYAMISYQMAYLKVYYRKYFNMAVLNVEKDEEKLQRTINDCYKHNIQLQDYNVNEISYDFIIKDNKDVIIPGCKILKGIGSKTINKIIENKPFKDFNDFLKRTKARINVIEILFKYDFFKNAFGEVENNNVKTFLKNKNKRSLK